MSKSISSSFPQIERKSEMTVPSMNSWNIPFNSGTWGFPRSELSGSLSSQSVNPSPSLPSQPTLTTQSAPTPHSQPIILMSPTWNMANSPAPSQCHFSFTNDTDNLQITITDHFHGTSTTHFIGKGTKFSFTAPSDHQLSVNVSAKIDTPLGIVAQVDNDPFNLRRK